MLRLGLLCLLWIATSPSIEAQTTASTGEDDGTTVAPMSYYPVRIPVEDRGVDVATETQENGIQVLARPYPYYAGKKSSEEASASSASESSEGSASAESSKESAPAAGAKAPPFVYFWRLPTPQAESDEETTTEAATTTAAPSKPQGPNLHLFFIAPWRQRRFR